MTLSNDFKNKVYCRSIIMGIVNLVFGCEENSIHQTIGILYTLILVSKLLFKVNKIILNHQILSHFKLGTAEINMSK